MLLQFKMDQPRSSILKYILQIFGNGEIRVCDVKIDGRPQDDLVGGGEVVVRALQLSLVIRFGPRHVAGPMLGIQNIAKRRNRRGARCRGLVLWLLIVR